MKNFTLIFWESQDDYKYERIVSIANYVQDIQTNIWYIEFANCWITTSKSSILHVWDMEKEVKITDLSTPLIHSNIIDIVPIEVLKLIAVSSMDKMITIWSLQERRIVITLDMSVGGIHTTLWSANYQVLITAGYENTIKIWNIDPIYHDISLAGKLKGHMGMLYAVEAIPKTPMVVSCDDLGHFKVWDIRTLRCVQTIKLDAKLTVNRIMSLYEYGKLAFFGKRLNFIEFEKELTLTSKGKTKAKENVWPIKADYDFTNDQMIVCTRKDIRFLDLQNGRIKKVFSGLLKHEESEIGVFKLLQQGTKFLLGDDRGNMSVYNTSTGEKIKELVSHSNEVTSLEVDRENNLIISSGVDSCINIQKEGKVNYEVKRSIKNINFNKGVSFMDVSVYHSLIITMGNNNFVFVWDYEYAKLLASIQGPRISELTMVYTFNHYPLVVVADTLGKVHFLSFKRRDTVNIVFQKVAEIDLSDADSADSPPFVTKAIAEIHQVGESKIPVLYLSTNKGDIRIYNIQNIILHCDISSTPHANTKPNYNCNRILDEDFLKSIHNYKVYTFYLDSGEETHAPASKNTRTKSFLAPDLVRAFKAHDDTLTALNIIHIPDKKLVSTSIDSFVKIWSLDGALLGSLSINHPLPMNWDIKVNDSQKYKKKIFYALKVLDGILTKNKANMFIDEEKKISINNFIKKFYGPPSETKLFVPERRGTRQNTQQPKVKSIDVGKVRRDKVLTMEDEYSAEALKLNRTIYTFEPKYDGPSLKQQAVLRRINDSSQRAAPVLCKEELQRQKDEEIDQERRVDDEKRSREFFQFLLSDVNKPEGGEFDTEHPVRKNLSKKLDDGLVDPRKKDEKEETREKSPRSGLFALQQRRFLKLRELSSQNTMNCDQGSALSSATTKPFSINFDEIVIPSSTKSRENALLSRASRLKASANLSQESFNPAKRLVSENDKSDLLFNYAKQRMNFDGHKTLTSFTSSSTLASPQLETTKNNKLQRKNIGQILHRLNENKMKSQFQSSTSTNFFKPPPEAEKEDLIYLRSPPPRIESRNKTKDESGLSLTNYETFVTNQRGKKGIKSFKQELKDFQEYVEDSWKVNMKTEASPPKPKKFVYNKLMKQITNKEKNKNHNDYQFTQDPKLRTSMGFTGKGLTSLGSIINMNDKLLLNKSAENRKGKKNSSSIVVENN